jgi:transposase
LVHARKAKLMMGCVNKTDRLDVRGLNRLQQAGTLPTVWIPPGELRDQRELTRSRIYLVAIRTRLKNRIHADLGKYGLSLSEVDDIFGPASRSQLLSVLGQLPEHAQSTAREQLGYVDDLGKSITWLNGEINRVLQETAAMQLLQSLPGIGDVLSKVVGLEIGDVHRFWSAAALASYAGTVPRVHASGGRVRYGKTRPDVNRYLKWAYAEAANSIVINQKVYPNRHVTQLYQRVRAKRGHAKAIGAVSRHLAESSYWVLRKQETYKDPFLRQEMSTNV